MTRGQCLLPSLLFYQSPLHPPPPPYLHQSSPASATPPPFPTTQKKPSPLSEGPYCYLTHLSIHRNTLPHHSPFCNSHTAHLPPNATPGRKRLPDIMLLITLQYPQPEIFTAVHNRYPKFDQQLFRIRKPTHYLLINHNQIVTKTSTFHYQNITNCTITSYSSLSG